MEVARASTSPGESSDFDFSRDLAGSEGGLCARLSPFC
jgi:hypothetical protein